MAYASLAEAAAGPGGRTDFATSPQPFQVQNPNQGLFRAVGDNTMSQIFRKNADNSISAYTISDWGNQGNDLFTQQERAPGAMYSMYGPGGSYGLARTRLQSQYGLDVSKLPEYNIGDLRSAGSTLSGFNGSLKDFLGTNQTAATPGNTQTLNAPGTSMASATPEQIAAQKANPAYFSPAQAQAQADQQRTAQGLLPQTTPGGASSVPGTGPGGVPLQPVGTQPPAPAQPGTPGAPGTQPTGTNLYAGAANYKGPSIVDFLSYAGQPNSFADRAQLAAKMGIQNYTGTAAQNTQMLNTLRGQISGAGGALAGVGATSGLGTTGIGTGGTAGAGGDTGTLDLQSRLDAIMQKWGISAPNPNQSPMTTFADTYQQLLNKMGVPSIKDEFNKLQQRYSDLLDKKATEQKDINSNPWISESLRLKELKALDGAYENRTRGLTEQMKLYESMAQKGIEEARFVAQETVNIAHQNAQLDEARLSRAIQMAEYEANSVFKQRELALQEQRAGQQARIEERRTSLEEARYLLELRKEKFAESKIGQAGQAGSSILSSNDFKSTTLGKAYVDVSAYKGKELSRAIAEANATGAAVVKRGTDATALDGLNTAVKNLNYMEGLFKQLAPGGFFEKSWDKISNPLSSFFGTEFGDRLRAYQSNRDSLFQQINALAGSHPRINTQELLTAANALPKLDEFNMDTLRQGLDKTTQTRTYLHHAEDSILGTRSTEADINTANPNYSIYQPIQNFMSASPQNAGIVDGLMRQFPNSTPQQIISALGLH